MRALHRTLIAIGAASLIAAAVPAHAVSSVDPFVKLPAGGTPYAFTSLLTVGERVPSPDGGQYRLVGIPDGMGAHRNPDGTITVYVAHELNPSTLSQPYVGGPLHRGAFVSRFVLGEDEDTGAWEVLSGERAYDRVYQDNKLIGDPALETNAVRSFARFCSASLAGEAEGFDRPIFFANEEEDVDPNTFDGKGGQTVAILQGDRGTWEAHALSRLGHFSKENTLAQPRSDELTVLIPTEDGPSTPDSQLWLYVGEKERSRGASVLDRNGLLNGKLYVFVADGFESEADAYGTDTEIAGRWVRVPRAKHLTTEELEAAADAVGAFGFIRVEDGAFSKTNPNTFYFVTTGSGYRRADGSHVNELGRLYRLELHPGNPRRPATLTIEYDAQELVAAGEDVAISPDNLDVSEDTLMIQEDGTSESRARMAALGRDGQIWAFPLLPDGSVDLSGRAPVAELDAWTSRWLKPDGTQARPGPGVWESSGIIDLAAILGPDAWLFNVQSHRPSGAASWPPATVDAPYTVEDGQLLLMTPAST